jgi:hypothetical protein
LGRLLFNDYLRQHKTLIAAAPTRQDFITFLITGSDSSKAIINAQMLILLSL